jgi:hypothetical protein
MVFKKVKNWWKKLEDKYGQMDKKDAFMMGRADAMNLGLQAKLERDKRKKQRKKDKKRGYK